MKLVRVCGHYGIVFGYMNNMIVVIIVSSRVMQMESPYGHSLNIYFENIFMFRLHSTSVFNLTAFFTTNPMKERFMKMVHLVQTRKMTSWDRTRQLSTLGRFPTMWGQCLMTLIVSPGHTHLPLTQSKMFIRVMYLEAI